MKIVYIHYHLKRGGVTTVIKQQVEAVKKSCSVLILTGEKSDIKIDTEVKVIDGLGYDNTDIENKNPESIAANIIKTIYGKWHDGCDIIHIHNSILAKNRNFLKIIDALKQYNIPLFLQIHDFAEDGRPNAYFLKEEYTKDCHYGVINTRDYKILKDAGLKNEGLHLLENMVSPLDCSCGGKIPENFVLYPVRAIRRKNIGEAILLSLYFIDNTSLKITLPPGSPADIVSHNNWKKFARKNKLDVVFEASLLQNYLDLVKSAKFIITTSITEGFGFVFLEPYTADKIVKGRKLNDICCDFEKKGILLNSMYNSLIVPLTLAEKEKFYKRWEKTILKSYACFNRFIEKKEIKEKFRKVISDFHYIDFGMLHEENQKQVLSKIISDDKYRQDVLSLNPFLSEINNTSVYKKNICINKQKVLSNYNIDIYSDKLRNIYDKVINIKVCHKIDKNSLLNKFLDLERFSLLKWNL